MSFLFLLAPKRVVLVALILAGCSNIEALREPFVRCVLERAEKIKLDANKSLLRRAEIYCDARHSEYDRATHGDERQFYADEVREIQQRRERRAPRP